MRSIVVAGCLLLVTACAADESDPPSEPPPACAPADRPLICGRGLNIAHRGGRNLAPENTLAAFENAAGIDGVQALELDVHATSDGVVVVIHDETVDRTTDGTGAVSEMTFETLRQLDAGYHFTDDGGATFPFRGQGVVVPTLEEVLAAFPDYPFAIEIKQATPRINDEVVAAIEAAGAWDRAQIASFHDDVLLELRADHPDLFTSMGTAEIAIFLTLPPEDVASYEPPARVIQAPKGTIDAAMMQRANDLGVTVHAWTVNDEAEMRALLELDVHGIMTDDPALLATVISER